MNLRFKFLGLMNHGLIFLALIGLTVGRADEKSATPTPVVKGPLSPEESLKHFVLADPNLQIEIVAAEPEVIDPVAIQFDEHGRLWVVELSDYPNGPEPGKPPLSRIKLLEDKDGDGRFETAHIFADKLLFATGVQPWDGGVIVTLAGEVAYFKDTDGDHKADVRETWFTGFAQANPQLRANHPTFGPDGWIYVANGLRGGNVIAVKKDWPVKGEGERGRKGEGEKDKAQPASSPPLPLSPSPPPQPVSLTGRDFKFDPLTGRHEAISGNGQFGMTFDVWGNRFVCDNRHPCRHVIFEEDFIKRCPHVAFPAVVHDVIPADDKNQVFPLTSAWTTSNLHAGTFTAACGVTVYTGDWLPEEFRGNVFVCEPTGNLVQRAILEPDGVTFKSRNPYQSRPDAPRQEKPNAPLTPANQSASNANPAVLSRSDRSTEFLASRDDWFRPVDLQNGPDGALYVVDMYRAVIEHPEWVPDELKKRPDTWLGNDKGRIYRIRPKSRPHVPREDQPSAPSTSDGKSASTARSANLTRNVRATKGEPLVSVANLDASINSPNGWYRMTASRVLHELSIRSDSFPVIDPRRDEAAFLTLRARRLGRLVGGTNAIRFLFESNPNVVAEAVSVLHEIAAEHQLLEIAAEHQLSAIEDFVLIALWNDSALVRFRTIQGCSWSPKFAKRIHSNFAFQPDGDPADEWIRQAIIGIASVAPMQLFDQVFSHGSVLNGDQRDFARMLAQQAGFEVGRISDEKEFNQQIRKVMKSLSEVAWEGDQFDFVHAAEAALGFEKGLNGSGRSLSKTNLLFFDWCKDLPPPSGGGKRGDCSLGQRALSFLGDDPKSDDDTRLAIRLLRLGSFERASTTLQKVGESTDQSLRLVVIETIGAFTASEVTSWLIERYRSETPAIRRAILAALFASKERQLRLLEAIEQGQIAATELDPVRVNQ
ncbi:MAG: PVC-type heme-binding CxxCH protein, partial [Planctomycetaceae bacterium]